MVAPSGGSTTDGPPDSRAQLILVGSIAIAVVLVGITLVINSAVFTENVAGGSSVEVTGDVSEFDREAVRNVRSLTIRVNHDSVYSDSPPGGPPDADLEADLRRNLSGYSRVLAESYADTSSVYVNLTFEEVGEYGTRIYQREDSNFRSGPGQGNNPNWQTAEGPFQLGWFVTNFDVENVSRSNRLYVSLTNSSDTELNVSVKRDSSNRLQINSSVGGSHVSNTTCKPENGRVLLNVKAGTSYSGDCEFNSTSYLDPPYDELEFKNGDAGTGKYDIVVNQTTGSPPGVGMACHSAAVDIPCNADAVWSVNFTTRYQTGSVEYENTHNVTVYDP